MIIKDMAEFARHFGPNDRAFEVNTLAPEGKWKEVNVGPIRVSTIYEYVQNGYLRIKPATITLYEFTDLRGENRWAELGEVDKSWNTGRTITSAVIERIEDE